MVVVKFQQFVVLTIRCGAYSSGWLLQK